MLSSIKRKPLRARRAGGRVVRRSAGHLGAISTLVLAAAGAMPCIAAAQIIYVGPDNGDWGTAANWSTGSVPGSADNVVVDNRGNNFAVLTGSGSSRSANNLQINSGDAVEISNASQLTLGGNLTGPGTLRFNVGANRSNLVFNSSTASIASGSTIDFNYQGGTNADGAILGPGTGTLTNHGLIRGSGTLNNVRFTNAADGIVESYQTTAQLYLDANNAATGLFVNLGTIRALAGATVTFAGDAGGDFVSTGGLIQANGAGAIVRFVNGASVTGGTYSTTGGGQIVVESGHTGNASNFTNNGTFVLRNNSTLNVSGTITNNGTINFTQPYTTESFLQIVGDTTLAGSGVVQMDYSNTAGGPAGVIAGSGTLTIGAGQTIRGVGSLRNLKVNNAGLIDANSAAGAAVGGSIYLDPNNSGVGLFTNTGTVRSSAGGLLVISGDSGGDFVNTGGTIASTGAGSISELFNGIIVTGGTFATSSGGLIRVRPGSSATLNGPITFSSGTTFAVPATPSVATSVAVSGTLNNTGSTIQLNANGNLALLSLTGNTTLNGGTLSGLYTNVSGNVGPRVDTLGNTLTIAANTTAQGVINFSNARVVNNGTLNANSADGMNIDPSNQAAGLFVNNALMEATNGGLMVITGDFGGDLVNTSGSIVSSGAGSIVEFNNGVSVTGGMFASNAGGVLRVRPGTTATLNGPVTLTSGTTLSVPTTPSQSAVLYAAGTFSNTGSTIQLNATGNLSLLSLVGDVTINGGTVSGLYTNVNNSPGPRIDTGSNTLTVSASTTVQGVVYFSNARLVNNGTINASNVDGMYVDPSNQSGTSDLFVNNGLMEATAGGLMVITGDGGGGLNNTNGTITSSGTNSLVEFYNTVAVTGGTLTTSGGGVMRVRPGSIATLNGPATITSGSKLTVGTTPSSAVTLNLNGTLTNNGTLELNAVGGQLPLLNIAGNTTIAGSGQINAVYGGSGAGPRIDTGSNTLTIGANQTVAGILYMSNARVVNNGTMLANVHQAADTLGSFDMYLDASNQTASPLFVNNGTIHATNNASIGFTGDGGGTFSGTGPIIVDAGSVVGSWNTASGDMGPVSGAGLYRAANSANLGHQSFRLPTVEAINSATARITAGGGIAGTSKVSTLTLSNDGRFDVTDHALIVDATPIATIRAYLASGRNSGNWSGPGINSSLATANSHRSVGYALASDVFTTVPATFLGQPITAASVLVRFTTDGDANLDGKTDFSDLLALARNYGNPGVWRTGDFDYSGDVGFPDLLALARAYGNALPSAEQQSLLTSVSPDRTFVADFALAQSLVPEPATAFAALGLLAIRRRR